MYLIIYLVIVISLIVLLDTLSHYTCKKNIT